MIVKKSVTLILFLIGMISIAGEIYRPEFKLLPLGSRCSSDCKPFCGETLLIAAEKMQDFNIVPTERTAARGFYDQDNLYIKVNCEDRDIISEVTSPKNAAPGNAADTIQIILKSEKDYGIWVINVTANKIVNNIFYHSAGSIITPTIPAETGVKADITLLGTLNKMDDTDKGWETLIKIPKKLFQNRSFKFIPEENWTILVRRYNYGIQLKARELSSFPQMTMFDHFEPARYARITFAR